MTQEQKLPWWVRRSTQSLVLFVTGLALIIKDSINGVERPTFIAAYLVMMGVPAAFLADERRRARNEDDEE